MSGPLRMVGRLSRPLSRLPLSTRCIPSPSSLSVYSTSYGHDHEHNYKRGERRSHRHPVLALSWILTLKHLLGLDDFDLDSDPIKDKIKKSWLARKYKKYEEAVALLDAALIEARERKEEMAETRVIDELANTFYEKGDNGQAEQHFRTAIKRLVELHGTRDSDPAFIGISLKLADLLARRGEIKNAETGFAHCIRKQMAVSDAHLASSTVAGGALAEDRHAMDTRGAAHSDPVALLGMCLDSYARFLVTFCDEGRQAEADEYMSEVLKICYQIYGVRSAHSIHLLNNYGAQCVLKQRFASAARFLSLAVERAAMLEECSSLLPGLYCNYAEALFHTGKKEEAVEWARRAVRLARMADVTLQRYTSTFLADLQKETGTRKRFYFF